MAHACAAPSPDVLSPRTLDRVALVGNPNTGKTTLFNRLCGANAKTSNFPGTTTSTRLGRSRVSETRSIEVIDLPGLYGLSATGPEGLIAREILLGTGPHGRPDAVIVLVDATNLARNLVLVGELIARDETVVVALNMMDMAKRRGLTVDVDALSKRIGAPVVATVASKGLGLDAVRKVLDGLGSGSERTTRPIDAPSSTAPVDAVTDWAERIAREVTHTSGGDAMAIDARTERLDRLLTHPVAGTVVFLAVMGGLFWSLFALATLPMDLIDATFAQLGGLVSRFLPEGPVRALISDGIIGGIAGTAVFLPQICLLFFLISLLEDTGYLARAAFVNDRFFHRFGLPGQAFVPLLTSHACALPGIMSARLIPDRRDRLATILVAPFMSCSARLPVYVLLTSLLFADRPALAGLAFAGCYVLGAAAAFFSALLFGRTVLRGRARPMVLELPTYKRPSLMNALVAAKDQGLSFLKTVGTVIMAICIVMWWLSAYPRVEAVPEAQALRAQAQAAGLPTGQAHELSARANAVQAAAQEAGSFAGRIGRAIEPVFRPLGYDWQLTVGVLTSFVAREVFVSTMSVLAGGGDGEGVVMHIRTMKRADGTLVFTRATAASALVFFVLAMQCLATLTVTRRETGSIKYAALQLGYMSSLAYVAAFLVFQGLRLWGVS
jgi:ferrous iron transport protein B